MAQNNSSLAELTALIEGIVAQALTKSLGGQMATWAANNARTSLYLSHETGDRLGNDMRVAGDLYNVGKLIQSLATDTRFKNLKLGDGAKKFGGDLMGLAGMYGAYQSGDAISGALAGMQFGPWGAAIGFLAGLVSPGVDKWQRPKFKNAKQAFDKLFSMDRGERDQYYLPDSFYFRTGGNGTRNVVVQVGNQQFDDHIRESLTNNYASQLQRGLVF